MVETKTLVVHNHNFLKANLYKNTPSSSKRFSVNICKVQQKPQKTAKHEEFCILINIRSRNSIINSHEYS